MKENPLHLIMNPRSIATVGAGNNPLKMGTIQALSIIKDGFMGKFMPVHPTEKTVPVSRPIRQSWTCRNRRTWPCLWCQLDRVIPLLEDSGKLVPGGR